MYHRVPSMRSPTIIEDTQWKLAHEVPIIRSSENVPWMIVFTDSCIIQYEKREASRKVQLTDSLKTQGKKSVQVIASNQLTLSEAFGMKSPGTSWEAQQGKILRTYQCSQTWLIIRQRTAGQKNAGVHTHKMTKRVRYRN